MKLIRRDKSIVTGEKRLEHLVTYKKYPVLIGCTKKPKASDLLADMSFSICKDSGIIQLDRLIPLNILYSEYHSEAIGGTWTEHHKQFIDFFSAYSPKQVLEIGGSNCFMAEQYVGTKKDVFWTNVEPNPVRSKNPRVKVIPKLFDGNFKMKGDVDAVIHSHTLEHMYDPDAFLAQISGLIKPGTLHIFSLPNLDLYLKNGQSNCINFEHTLFLTEYFVDYFLAKNGFEILEKRYFRDHSIFYATRKRAKALPKPLVSKYKEYRARFTQYVRDNNAIVADINRKLAKNKGNVYLFGAHVFSQLLVNLGLKTTNIRCILDNSKIKQGKRLYGTNLTVQSPEILRGKQKPVIILRVGAYTEEVRKQIQKINKSALFIE